MKFSPDRPYSDRDAAARKLLEITNAVEAAQGGRIQIEKINAPFLFRERAYAGRIQCWSEAGDRTRPAGSSPERDLCEVHAGGCGSIRSSKVQSVDQRMRLECGVCFRQLRTCRRTRPGQLCA